MNIKNYLKPSKQFDIEELIRFAIEILGIKHVEELVLVHNERLLNTLSGDIEFSALLCNTLPNKYVLHIKDGAVSSTILCHELIHLHQYDRGDLKANSDYTEIIWKGEKYNSSTPYNEREWEEEAFSMQNWLWRKFKQMKKQQKKNEKSKS